MTFVPQAESPPRHVTLSMHMCIIVQSLSEVCTDFSFNDYFIICGAFWTFSTERAKVARAEHVVGEQLQRLTGPLEMVRLYAWEVHDSHDTLDGLKPGSQYDATLMQRDAGRGIGSISNPASRCVSVASYCEPGQAACHTWTSNRCIN